MVVVLYTLDIDSTSWIFPTDFQNLVLRIYIFCNIVLTGAVHFANGSELILYQSISLPNIYLLNAKVVKL